MFWLSWLVQGQPDLMINLTLTVDVNINHNSLLKLHLNTSCLFVKKANLLTKDFFFFKLTLRKIGLHEHHTIEHSIVCIW